jgi:myosin heavy subunit
VAGCAGAASSTCAVPAAKTEAAEGSVESTLQTMREAMVNYDNMLALARQLNDPKALRIISDCKSNWSKRTRKVDPKVKQQLDEDLANRIKERDELRKRCRKEEADAAAAKRQKKNEAAKKAKSAKKQADKDVMKQLQMQIDTKWSEASFGQDLADAKNSMNYKKESKAVISNYREAFNRLRMRCPPLPDHLAAQWDDLQE